MDKNSLHISEKEQVSGGEFQDVRISGAANITNDLTCHALHVSGAAVVDGSVTCQDVHISGRSQVNGMMTALSQVNVSGKLALTQKIIGKAIKVSGSLKTEKELEVESLQVSGSVKALALVGETIRVSGNLDLKETLKVQELGVSGWIKTGQTIEAEQIKVSGRLNCEGFINAEQIELESMSGSSFNEIGASTIKIVRYQSGKPINQVFSSIIQTVAGPFSPIKRITGNVIEGDTIYVEYAKIKKMSGQDIVIGPECEIDEIEYSGTLKIHEKSVVKHQERR